MAITRRQICTRGLGTALALATGLSAGGALALEPDAAKAHVRRAIDEVLDLVTAPGSDAKKADDLRRLLERYAAMPQIARFAAGLAWRDMSEDQQQRFADAFAHYLSVAYARRFSEYSGQEVTITGVEDSGRRGLTVTSRVSQSSGQPVTVDWLVSDRPGRVVIADIVIEGVSLLVTQREEISGMLSGRGGDVERLISDLSKA